MGLSYLISHTMFISPLMWTHAIPTTKCSGRYCVRARPVDGPMADHFRPLYRALTTLPAQAGDSSARALTRACSESPGWWAADTLSPSGACTCAALRAARCACRASSARRADATDARCASSSAACDGGSESSKSVLSTEPTRTRWHARQRKQSGRKGRWHAGTNGMRGAPWRLAELNHA